MTEQMTPETPEVEEEPMADEPMAAEGTPGAEDGPMADEPMAAEGTPAAEEEPMAATESPSDARVEDEPMAAAETPAEAAADEAPAEETPAEEAAAAEPKPEPAPAPRREKQREPEPEGVPASARPTGPRGLQLKYRADVVPAMVKQFEYANPNQVPRLAKIVVNVGIGEALTNAKAIDAASGDLTTITGQKPIVMKARRSIAQFKIRTGNPIGLKVTLRGERMWDFLERLTLLTLPRIRDFRGIPSRSFDGRGNYTMGLREQIAFPEIDYDKVDRLRGLEISIVTTAKSDEESKRLLELLGMPFAS
jgi:large subunit ribosomal protein L5